MKIEEEREYCLNCINKPCENLGCPLENDIPNFIHEEDEEKAFELLCKTTVLPAVCGRICPKSRYCQGNCIRRFRGKPVEIGQIESHIGDTAIEKNFKIPKVQNFNNEDEISKENESKQQNNAKSQLTNTKKILEKNHQEKDSIDEIAQSNNSSTDLQNKKVAVVGAGPAGLTCSAFLAMQGVNVTIYEKNKNLGGLLTYGIPEFRLEKSIVKKSVEKILELGISVKTGYELGRNLDLKTLSEEYDAVFLAIGAEKPKRVLKGENVLSGNEILEEIAKIREDNAKIKFKNNIDNAEENPLASTINFSKKSNEENNNYIKISNEKNEINLPDFKGKTVIVYGGGNVAMDTARTLTRLGANVSIVYRRNIAQMPAEAKEIEDAQNDGVRILENTSILSFENHTANCIKTRLVQIDPEFTTNKADKNNQLKIEENKNIEFNENKNSNVKNSNLNEEKPININELKILENQEKIKNDKFKLLSEKQATRQNTRIENIEGSEFEISSDYVVLAIGSEAETKLLQSQGIETNEKGFAKINANKQTSIPNVYAGGDLVGEEVTVANASRSGRETAKAIILNFNK